MLKKFKLLFVLTPMMLASCGGSQTSSNQASNTSIPTISVNSSSNAVVDSSSEESSLKESSSVVVDPLADKEGLDLCQWKTDHKNCTFLMKSKGAYQYIEDDICHTVLRGTSPYEKEKKREDWEFGEILKITLDEFKFNEDIGVIKHVKKIQC